MVEIGKKMKKIKERFQWSDSLSVGVSVLDYQHRNVINVLNEIIDEIEKSNPKKSFIQILLDDLHEHVMHHLKYEEELLKKHHYPDYDQHKEEHDRYRVEISKLRNIIDEDIEEILETTQAFLEFWWYSHIMEEDMNYKSFFEHDGFA